MGSAIPCASQTQNSSGPYDPGGRASESLWRMRACASLANAALLRPRTARSAKTKENRAPMSTMPQARRTKSSPQRVTTSLESPLATAPTEAKAHPKSEAVAIDNHAHSNGVMTLMTECSRHTCRQRNPSSCLSECVSRRPRSEEIPKSLRRARTTSLTSEVDPKNLLNRFASGVPSRVAMDPCGIAARHVKNQAADDRRAHRTDVHVLPEDDQDGSRLFLHGSRLTAPAVESSMRPRAHRAADHPEPFTVGPLPPPTAMNAAADEGLVKSVSVARRPSGARWAWSSPLLARTPAGALQPSGRCPIHQEDLQCRGVEHDRAPRLGPELPGVGAYRL